MVKRDVFERVGGFDEALEGSLLAADFGLRLAEAGFRVLVTPYAHARWLEDRSHEPVAPEAERQAATRWGHRLEQDPYYNVHFDRTAATFRLPSI
jgi:hypothetical protein